MKRIDETTPERIRRVCRPFWERRPRSPIWLTAIGLLIMVLSLVAIGWLTRSALIDFFNEYYGQVFD